ncbi:MAG: nucleoside triphosphate pyrophosphohydrolase [Acidobacteria bacterium]|nr:nucleoside triphosphate pyrophosphohydrolase [Acidobacteriota bacterium]
MDEISRLISIMAKLREPGGCPWDREQTPSTLRPYVLEEAYEVAEAIDSGDHEELRLELGDLLLQVVFLSRVAEEQGWFDFHAVARGIADKLVRRHPHVFGDASAETVAEVWRRWDAIKEAERAARGVDGDPVSRLDGVPKALPALARARLLTEKAARAGFDWNGASDVLVKVKEELAETEAVLGGDDPARRDEEIGDLLFAITSLARHAGVDAEGSLGRACAKFTHRFRHVERLARERGLSLDALDPAALDDLWNEAKTVV